MASVFVPQANPRAAYHAHKQAIDEAIARVLASGSYILGEEAKNFEHEYARWVGTRRAVACATGTDAIAFIFSGQYRRRFNRSYRLSHGCRHRGGYTDGRNHSPSFWISNRRPTR